MRLPVKTHAVDDFFHGVRNAIERGSIRNFVGPIDVIAIAHDPAQRVAFRDSYRQVNDPDMKSAIKDYLHDVISDLERAAGRTVLKADLIDRAGMAPSGAITVAGVVALASGGLAAPFLLGGGLLGLIASGVGRTLLSTSAGDSRHHADKVTQLLEVLD